MHNHHPETKVKNLQQAMGEAAMRAQQAKRADQEAKEIKTTVNLCNKTKHERIYVSWAYRRTAYDGVGVRWRGRGGFEVKRGDCLLAGAYNEAPGVGYSGPMFFYASTNGKPGDARYLEWQGTGLPFCVALEGEFTHSEAWKMNCDPSKGKLIRGHEYSASPGAGSFHFVSDGKPWPQ